jgi:outer membrane protein assembly factor BamD
MMNRFFKTASFLILFCLKNRMRLIFKQVFLIFCLSFALTGCETLKSLTGSGSAGAEKPDEYKGWNAKQFYTDAKEAMQKGNYQKAIQLYEALESRYPFGEYSAQTQLDLAYAYYKNEENESAAAAIDRFIKLNPRSEHIDYAYYLKGLISYNRNMTFLNRFIPTDVTQRDTGNSVEALNIFLELERRFPNSKYLPDARKRVMALRNLIAMHEVKIARFYLKRKAYVAAVNRASAVVKEYQNTAAIPAAVPYALQVMQEAYTKLGMTELAQDTQQIYNQNYPDGPPVPEQVDSSFAQDVWDFIGLDE